ncbi:thioesterase II family protein [Sphingomonas sp. MMS12-HWE2-04]|uniref:thioesterase II family protein n=1 Tax=Sphingomonas sp. MMS12-HWE2-04 TaxID=3234199 RepID=UPI00384BE5CF
MRTIYIFPYGGGSAGSYRSYAARFPTEVARVIPVEISGHGKRAQEDFATSIEECAARTLEQIDTTGDYILHGHCMGALLAFEATKLIEARQRPLPSLLVASGRNAPRHASAWLSRVPELDDQSLFKEMQEFGGIPKGLSFAMARDFLTVIRSDQAMFRDYDPGDTKIDVPILALAGSEDQMTNAAALAEWQNYTSGAVAIEWLEGGHYFLLQQPDRVAALVEHFGGRAGSSALAEGHAA